MGRYGSFLHYAVLNETDKTPGVDFSGGAYLEEHAVKKTCS